MTNLSDSNPRIYVACLAAYNNGYLHGAWIEADQDADEIRDEIAAMLARSPIEHAEEYAIHDYEGFEGVTIRLSAISVRRGTAITSPMSESSNPRASPHW